MLKGKMLILGVFITILLFLSSCYPVFMNPLPYRSGDSIDKALLGNWVIYKEDVLKDQLCITPRKDGWMNIIYIYDIDRKCKEILNLISFEGYVSKISDKNYLNMKVQISEQEYGYIIAEYSFDDSDTVFFKFPSLGKIEALIKSKKLKGEVSTEEVLSGKYGRSVIVKSEPNDIINVFSGLSENEIFENKQDLNFRFTRYR